MLRPLRTSASGVEGSCKEPVPKKLLKDPEPGVAPLGPLIVPSLAQRAPRSLFLARPKGTRSRHPYGASSADLSDHLRATRTSSVTLRFAQGKPAVHHLRAARTPWRLCNAYVRQLPDGHPPPHPSPAERDSGKMLYILPPTRCRATPSTTLFLILM